jgi:hypothetical protein
MLNIIFAIILIIPISTFASIKCNISEFLKSEEGQQKLSQISERSKSLIISKLEEIGLEEKHIKINTLIPKRYQEKIDKGLTIEILNGPKKFRISGESLTLTKMEYKTKEEGEKFTDEVCGLEVKFFGGKLLDKETGREISLGRVKEFIRLN